VLRDLSHHVAVMTIRSIHHWCNTDGGGAGTGCGHGVDLTRGETDLAYSVSEVRL
jgi:hypothetical protein